MRAAGKVLRGIVFDLDGTLRVPPNLDLEALRRSLLRIGHRSDEQLKQARQALERANGKHGWALPGAREICDLLDFHRLRRGMITLSSRRDAEKFEAEIGAKSRFWPVFSKDDGHVAFKPSPEPLLRICNQWSVEPGEVLMVGDSAKHDVACGKSAGALTCLVDPLFRYQLETLPDPQRPDFRVHSLHELRRLIERRFRLTPSLKL